MKTAKAENRSLKTSPPDNEAFLGRLRKIEGQVRGIMKMIEDERDCGAILQQVAAVRAALYKVGLHYATDHVQDCLRELKTLPEQNQKDIVSLLKNIGKFT